MVQLEVTWITTFYVVYQNICDSNKRLLHFMLMFYSNFTI